jgi:hypothetical protein
VNFVNERREFFAATPQRSAPCFWRRSGGLLEFTQDVEALEYFQSRGRWLQPTDLFLALMASLAWEKPGPSR